MSESCGCTAEHASKRIVLTGGPGAGKTAVLELVHQLVCEHVVVIPEAASILFRGGFPRHGNNAQRAATQRAIFHLQHELESFADEADKAAILLCDRGTIDGAAYWPGPDDLFAAVGTTRDAELVRYDVVIHLRTPAAVAYNHKNPARIENAEEAAAIDARILDAWTGHPRRYVVDSTTDFLHKAGQALAILLDEIPACCRSHSQRVKSSSSTADSSSTFTGLVK